MEPSLEGLSEKTCWRGQTPYNCKPERHRGRASREPKYGEVRQGRYAGRATLSNPNVGSLIEALIGALIASLIEALVGALVGALVVALTGHWLGH